MNGFDIVAGILFWDENTKVGNIPNLQNFKGCNFLGGSDVFGSLGSMICMDPFFCCIPSEITLRFLFNFNLRLLNRRVWIQYYISIWKTVLEISSKSLSEYFDENLSKIEKKILDAQAASKVVKPHPLPVLTGIFQCSTLPN